MGELAAQSQGPMSTGETTQGKRQASTMQQCAQAGEYLNPSFGALKSVNLAEDILARCHRQYAIRTQHSVISKSAMMPYLAVYWKRLGRLVGHYGIHERSGREKIFHLKLRMP
ncbi:hypothetical protein BASA62_003055 [Batrachochytrium salamandrivorans]|nr:hypothetical protein BASA62_003055 [Batrachochytrium salamandrivorans]